MHRIFALTSPIFIAVLALLLLPSCGPQVSVDPSTVSYADVHAIFVEHCLECHSSDDPGGELVMESHGALMRGGESGPVVVPGNAGASELVTLVEKKKMPQGKRKKLARSEIAVLRAWIDGGAKP